MDYIIKKLGGENAAELHKSAKNMYDDYINGNLQAVVVSAVRSANFNTTDHLILLGEELSKEKPDQREAYRYLEELISFHKQLLEQKLICSQESILQVIENEFCELKDNIDFYLQRSDRVSVPSSKNDYCFGGKGGKLISLLGFGEYISCKIFSRVIDSLSIEGICSKSVDLGSIVTEAELSGKSESEIFDILAGKIALMVEEKVQGGFIPVLSGYMGTFSDGIESAIGRGYSDATAAITTVGLARRGYSVTLEIQKSVKGLLSADPRVLNTPGEAQVIQSLDYLTAREITGDCGAQAKLLHHQALRNEVQEAGVRIHLFDPFSKESTGSWIEPIQSKQNDTSKSGVEFIGGRKGVIFFSISSGKMFENGILTRLFSIVQEYFGVDIVSASETEVTFTLDSCSATKEILDEMTQKIRKEFSLQENTSMEFVEYEKKKGLIFCVGQYLKDQVGLLSRATSVLSKSGINIEIASQGRLQRAMIFGIAEEDVDKAVNVLHKEFIVDLQ